MITAKIGKQNFTTQVSVRNHSFIIDEPKELGGQDLGATPSEHLCAALASCTAITLSMYLQRKNWKVENIEVQVKKNVEENTQLNAFKVNINISGELDEQQQKRVLNVAHKCPVHKLLANGNAIKISLENN